MMNNADRPENLGHIDALLKIMVRLRDPDSGCPWDVKQTFNSIAPYTLEEAYEVVDAIERNNLNDLKEELGDLLLQVVFHARIAEEQGSFAFSDVVTSISEKMIRRHPHVFADGSAKTSDEVNATWEEIKQIEKEAKPGATSGLLDDVPANFPSLTQAVKLQKQAAKVGFDWPNAAPVLAKIEEELAELKEEVNAANADLMEEEFGDLMFVLTNYARHLKIDPDTALRRANQKFRSRFSSMESDAKDQSQSLSDFSLEQLESLWVLAKNKEKSKL